MKLMLTRLSIFLFCFCLLTLNSYAASPVTCFAVVSGDWNNPLIWADTALHAGGTCTATGGNALPIWGVTQVVPAGVPGAAGLKDRYVVNTGIHIHVLSTWGIDVGDTTGTVNAGVINATNLVTFGSVIVDDRALLRLNGNGSYLQTNITRYGVLQVMPGGFVQVADAGNTSRILADGRLYIGCGNQTKYPTPFCTGVGNAGAWVTASIGATLNITAVTSLPTLAIGDLVELDMVSQRTSWGYPYTGIDGKTPPPTPPVMPTTNDTNINPLLATCGTSADCKIPESTKLTVVDIVGNSITLGWPRGGASNNPYSTGAETPIAITNAGSGKLWLKKPANYGGIPSGTTWATAEVVAPAAVVGVFDATHSALALSHAPISNSANTGPGRKGDNSLVINVSNWGTTTCDKNSIQEVVANTCYIDYDKGVLWAFGFNFSFAGNISYNVASLPPTNTSTIRVTAGNLAGNEIVIENTDIRYLNGITTGASIIQFKGFTNGADNKAAFRFNTVRMSNGVVGDFGLQGTAIAPIEITENSKLGDNTASVPTNQSFIQAWSDSQYVDISHNYHKSPGVFLSGANYTFTAKHTHLNYTVTNNNLNTDCAIMGFVVGNLHGSDFFPGMLLQDNKMTGIGRSLGTNWPYQVLIYGLRNETVNNPIRIRYNYQYGAFRFTRSGSNVIYDHNYAVFNYHHIWLAGESGQDGGYVQNVEVHHNIFATNGAVDVGCFEAGYNVYQLLDNVKFYNNTCMGMSWAGGSTGDLGDNNNISLATGLQIYNNIFAITGTATGISKFNGLTSPVMIQAGLSYAGFNSMQGANSMYRAVKAPNSNNIPNPEYNRNTIVTKGGVNYNLDGARNVKGVVIQNPSYAAAQAGASLKFTYVSGSDMTLAWALDGINYGAATQLNWSPGVTYTLSINPTDPGLALGYLGITVVGAPFTALSGSGTPTPLTCPVARWALFLTGTNAGKAYGITSCTGVAGNPTGALNISPREPGMLAGDTFAIIKSEARLPDIGADYVDVGIDARALPVNNQTDAGISLSLTDYCNAGLGCGGVPVVIGLPTTFTAGVTASPLVPIPMPSLGGSAEAAFTGSYYRPTNAAWKVAGKTPLGVVGYIGAIPPSSNEIFPFIWTF